VKLPFLRAVFLAAVVALVAVGVATAANSFSFGDPGGDAGTGTSAGPDITGVAISSDDSGTLTFRVTLGNRTTALNSDDEVGVNLDVDQNPDTGSVLYGSEVGMLLDGTTLQFVRPDGADRFLAPASPPASLQGSFSNGVATFSVKASEIGISATGGFNVFAIAGNNSSGDTAPDIRTVNYQLVAGTPQPALGLDTRAPYDQAFTVHGKRGKLVHLDFVAADGRAQTAETLHVYRGTHVLLTRKSGVEDTNPFFVYYYAWRVPKHVRGKLRFCVSSVDVAGNKSNLACARIVLG
jgi:hypothetical protein